MGEQKYVRARYPAFHEEARMGSYGHPEIWSRKLSHSKRIFFWKKYNIKQEVMGEQKYVRARYPAFK